MRTKGRVLAGLSFTLLLVFAAIAAPAAAAPRRDRGLTIAVTPRQISAGEGVLIYGRLAGPGDAYRRVVLYHRIYPAPGFTPVSVTRTNAAGFYEFVRADGVVNSNRSWFVVGPRGSHSRTVLERVAADVALNAPGASATTAQTVTFSGSLDPAHYGQRVVLQEQDSAYGNGWRALAVGIAHGTTFTITHRFRTPGSYTLRALLPASARNIQSTSAAVSFTVQQQQNPAFTISASQPTVTDGQPDTISGTLYQAGSTSAGQAGVSVTLYGRQAHGRFQALATTTTDASGGYSFTQVPVHNTVYRVVAGSQQTAALYVGVQDVVTATLASPTAMAGQLVSVSGTVTPAHPGHVIYLQEQDAAGQWVNVSAALVHRDSTFTLHFIPGQDGTVNLRVQITGGPLDIGADSAALTLTVSGAAPAVSLPPSS